MAKAPSRAIQRCDQRKPPFFLADWQGVSGFNRQHQDDLGVPLQSCQLVNLVIIDDIGGVWDGGSTRLRTAFGAPLAADEFSTYVVKNMGFAAVNIYGRSCEIRIRPGLIKPKTLASLVDWLRARHFDRLITAPFDTHWRYRLHANRDAALRELGELVAAGRQPQPGDYLMRPLPGKTLPEVSPMHQALNSLIRNWPMLSQSVHRDGLWHIILSLQGRYHVVDAEPESQRLKFREIGRGFISYSDDWVSRACGTAIEEQEDPAYGRWVASVYRDVIAAGVPSVCDVDTIMTTPRLGRARVRYKRVLLPTRSAAGGFWLLSSSIIDNSIDLRAGLLQETA